MQLQPTLAPALGATPQAVPIAATPRARSHPRPKSVRYYRSGSAKSGKQHGERASAEATKQGKNAVIDARRQRGLTESKARASIERAVRELPTSRIDEVQLLGRNGNQLFEIVAKK